MSGEEFKFFGSIRYSTGNNDKALIRRFYLDNSKITIVLFSSDDSEENKVIMEVDDSRIVMTPEQAIKLFDDIKSFIEGE